MTGLEIAARCVAADLESYENRIKKERKAEDARVEAAREQDNTKETCNASGLFGAIDKKSIEDMVYSKTDYSIRIREETADGRSEEPFPPPPLK